MTFEELKEKALSLPYEPGVYIMQDKTNTVIYVGKAKKLKNRVSQYFQDSSAHTPKPGGWSRRSITSTDRCATEFEALVLARLSSGTCRNIISFLKDDKGYPYLRVNLHEEYPIDGWPRACRTTARSISAHTAAVLFRSM